MSDDGPKFPKPSKAARVRESYLDRAAAALERGTVRVLCIERERFRCALNNLGPPYRCSTPYSMGGELDHFFGRGKEDEKVETCWWLCVMHHHMKTNYQPDRRWWLEAFLVHCRLYGYTEEAAMVVARLALDNGKHGRST